MFKYAVIATTLLVSGCGWGYGGLNYVTVSTPTEDWKVVGGKDEQNVSFSVTRPDGATVTYHADGSNATAVLAQVAVQQQQMASTLAALVAKLVPLLAPAVGAP